MKDYKIGCVKCGAKKYLMMVAHRNKKGELVGWLFSCDFCFPFVSEGNVVISWNRRKGAQQ